MKRPRCGAKTRRGAPCQAGAIWSTRTHRFTRCKNHGGMSTGPRTAEGIERIRRAKWKHGRYPKEAGCRRSVSRLRPRAPSAMVLTTGEPPACRALPRFRLARFWSRSCCRPTRRDRTSSRMRTGGWEKRRACFMSVSPEFSGGRKSPRARPPGCSRGS
jgi:hypothetical protein